MKYILYLLAMLFLSLNSLSARADEGAAQHALEQAIADVKISFQNAKGKRFTFTMRESSSEEGPKEMEEEMQESGDESFVYAYHPLKPLAQRFIVTLPSKAENPKANANKLQELIKSEEQAKGKLEDLADHVLLVGGEDNEFEIDKLNFLRETETDFIYTLPIDGDLMDLDFSDTDDKEQLSAKEQKMARKMVEALRGEVYISKLGKPRFHKMHIWIDKSVKIQKGVKLKRLDMNTIIRPAYEGGPLITAKSTTDFKVKILLFSVKAREVEEVLSFKPVGG